MEALKEPVYGPFLRFESYSPPSAEEGATWRGSVLYICSAEATSTEELSCVIIDGTQRFTVAGRILETFKDWQFWRIDLKFTLENLQREISYQLELQSYPQPLWSFVLPSGTQVWRWAAYSCSGFSHDVKQEDWMVDGRHPLVDHLLNKHDQRPLHFNFGGGDQLYNDGVFEQPKIREWLRVPDRHTRHRQSFSTELRTEAEDFFFNHYCEHFNNISLQEMVARIPNVMLWDDHDIFDGWGSYPEDMLKSPVFYGIFLVAQKFYLLFQHHTTLQLAQREPSDLFGNCPNDCPSFSFLKLVGPTVAILGVDIRSERTKSRILSEESWELVFGKLRELPETVKHLIVNFTVPIVYPKVPISEGLYEMVSSMARINALNALLVKTNILSSIMKFEFDEPELLDDLVDHWTGAHHAEERKMVVERFQQLAMERQVRVTFLSGDVHCAAVGRFYSHPKMRDLTQDPFFMPQIITSAIINPPPPPVAIKLMHTFDTAGNRVNSRTREKMVRFFKQHYPREEKVLSKRNFLIMEDYDGDSLKATFFVEDHGAMLSDPRRFEMLIPDLKPDMSAQMGPSTKKILPSGRPPQSPPPLMRSPPVTPRSSR